MSSLRGKIAIVTGASRGIGRAIAYIFAKEGASLILNSTSDEIHHVAKDLTKRGTKVFTIQGDIKENKVVLEITRKAKEEFGKVDILVNNAGIFSLSILGLIKVEDMKKVFDVNVVSVINLTQYISRLMQPGSSIINISSLAGVKGAEGLSVYSASKGAVSAFTLAAAKELAHREIRVNAIAPGYINTKLLEQIPAKSKEKNIANIGLKRLGEADDVAKCALFLASDASSYITGQIIGVDGGLVQ